MKQHVITKRGAFVLLLTALIAWSSPSARAQFSVSVPLKTTAQPGEMITIPLTLTNAPGNSIDAFGLKVIFPGALLEYDAVSTAGTLTNGWLVVNGNETGPGEVTVGGFHIAPITTSGVLLNLNFTVKSGAAGKDSLRLTNFTDDLAGATAGNGEVEIPSAAATVFFAVLSGLNEVPPDTNNASGGGMFLLNADQDELTFNLRVRGLSGAMTAAHFHNAAAGSNGPVVRTLTLDFQGEVASGDWKSTDSEPLTPALVAALLNGEIYVNVHTAANPGGEIRGQVLLGKNMAFAATLNGGQEVPAVNTTANGAAAMTLDSVGSSLSFNVAVNGLSGPLSAAHFHNESAGVNGGVVRAITNDFVGTVASGVWKDSDAQALSPALVAELLAGRIYINVHTAANPGGEIRGQVFAADSVVFLTVLNGKQEVPSVTTNAHGGGRFVLNPERNALAFHVKYAELAEARTGAHFHNAAAGVNGPVVRAITEFVDTTAVGTWKSSDAQPLSLSLVAQLLAGNIYVNIHTASNPGGKIRGQLYSDRAIAFGAQVNGSQEVPPITTNAGGYGTFTLNAAGDSLTYNVGVIGLSGPLSAAHFHNNAAGKNGPVRRTITSSFNGAFAKGVWTKTDAEPLTPALVVELLTSNIYVNVHTAANPGGEIRGQVLPDLKPVVPIGLSRQIADGTRNVTIEGVVTTIDFNLGSTSSSEYYLQDLTGGIRMFVTGKPMLARGALVRVNNGTIASNAQRKNIETARDSIATLGTPGVPPPLVVTATEYLNNRANIEGELIRINNANIISGTWPASNTDQTVTINDGADLAMRLDRDTDIDGSPQPPNPMDIIGVATSFNGTPQIQPSSRAEILTATTFFATLNGAQENPPVNTNATGGGMFVLNSDGTALTYNVSITGLSGAITGAHFHNAATGSNGPVVRAITFTGETASGTWSSTDATQPLTSALLAELLAGNIYVNVHTAANPGGEIRGQVLVGTPQQLSARLSGSQEVPPFATNASGVGSFTLNAVGTELSYDVTVTGLSGAISAAHFHNAAAGVNGSVVRAITFTGNNANGIWKANDTQALTPALVAELLARKIYVNVHTAANPGGEIRGQVGAGAETVFLAVLNGAQENPPVNTNASGGGRFVLNADKTQLSYIIKVCNLSGAISAAHFHNAATGVNGPVVRAISFTDTTATGVWSSTDAVQPLTPALAAELLAGNIYVNVHTAANPGGEIRGQVLTGNTINLAAQINGDQEVPPVTTDGVGFGSFTLNPEGTELAFQVSITNLSGPLAAAHFHNAAAGKNGPVKRTLTNDFTGNTASGIWKSTDAEPLTPELAVELLAGKIYFNAHTAAHPGGEIRGQVLPGAQAVMPIIIARQTVNGNVVTVEGLVTRAAGRFTRIQDATAGLVVFQTSGSFRTAVDSGLVKQGDLLRVTGTLAEFSGLKEITPIQSFQVLSRDNDLPAAQTVTLAELRSNGEAYESELISLTGLRIVGTTDTVFAAGRTYNIVDASDTSRAVSFRTPSASDSKMTGLAIPKFTFAFEGVLTQFSSTDPAIGYQLQPVLPTDIVPETKVDESASELPVQFALLQNYPNPFNPTTNIRYDLPQNVRVKLVIYNLLGERVRTLVDADERAGAKQITWNGKNDAGVKVASGIYVYRLAAGTFTATRKLMLMK